MLEKGMSMTCLHCNEEGLGIININGILRWSRSKVDPKYGLGLVAAEHHCEYPMGFHWGFMLYALNTNYYYGSIIVTRLDNEGKNIKITADWIFEDFWRD